MQKIHYINHKTVLLCVGGGGFLATLLIQKLVEKNICKNKNNLII
jgi:hypothetical protein